MAAGMTFVLVDDRTAEHSTYLDRTGNLVEPTPLNQDGMASSSDNKANPYLHGWAGASAYSDWHFSSAQRIKDLSSKEDGWKGADSHSPTANMYELAIKMLSKLAREGIDRAPSIGLDYEGTYSFSWSDDAITVDVTIYDDGTYSFYASDANSSSVVDDANLSGPLHSRLLSVLLS